MIASGSNKWLDYTKHILKWEGKTSSDPKDLSAAKCVNAGQIHTNKGVTYCTFKAQAANLGIVPVTYARFLKLTDQDVAKFIYSYYNSVNGSSLPDSIALSLTEAAWGSGKDRAFQHLKEALADLGKIAKSNTGAITLANDVPEKDLFNAYFKRRYNYVVNQLGNSAAYAKYKNGWANRLNDFYQNFIPSNRGFFLFPLFFLVFLAYRATK